MRPGWVERPLGEVINLQRGFDLPTQDRKPGSIPVVSSSGVTGTHDSPAVSGPGVVTGRYGTIGEVFYIVEDFWPLNTTLFVQDFRGNDPRFVAYLLETLDFQAHNDKSSVPGVNRNDLHRIRVRVPTPAEQRKIGDIIGTIDDRTAANSRLILATESTFRAHYRAAVRAAGGENSLPVVPLEELCADSRISVDPNEIEAATPYIGLDRMPRHSIYLGTWGRADNVTSGKLRFQDGDILFGKLRAYFHKVGIALCDGVCSSDIMVLKAIEPTAVATLLFTISSDEFVEAASNASNGTRMPRASWAFMRRYPVRVLPSDLAASVSRDLETWRGLLRSIARQQAALSDLRGALLGPLIDGTLATGHSAELVEGSREPLGVCRGRP